VSKKTLSLAALTLLILSGTANAVNVRLEAHNQRSNTGTLSTLKWAGCPTFTAATACINPANADLAAMGITPSTAVWDWNPATGVLSMTGTFNSASTIGSSGAAAALPVIGDKVVDMVIDTVNESTTAASYACAEGTFLAGVGANGCLNLSLGDDFAFNSSVLYNVGGNATCVQRSIGGDDVSTGNPRGLVNRVGDGGCDTTDGGFELWTVLFDDTATGGQLRISNGIPISDPGTNYLTFTAAPDAVNDGPFNVLQGTTQELDVLANDVNFTDPVEVTVTTAPTKGTATVLGDSPGPQAGITIEYTAGASESGTDSFVYTVQSSGGGSDTATVTINILAGGANDDTASTTRNSAAININVGANDVGFTNPVTIVIISDPDTGGSATPPASGPLASAIVSYTPATTAPNTPTYTETFVYEVTDANDLVDTATVTVTVNNAIPVAGNGTVTISTQGSAPGSAPGNFNAATFAGNNLGNAPSVITATQGTNGATTVSGNVVSYTPAATFFSGTDTFDYTITDGDPGTPESDTGTVTVNIPNVTPAVAGGAITISQNTTSAPRALTITLGNGSLAQHTVAVSTQAANGNCALTGTSLTYTPNAGHVGTDSCVVTVTDGDGDPANATFTITINAAGGGGGGGGGGLLPGGSAFDAWSLALLGALPLLARRRDSRQRVRAGNR